MIPSLSAGLPVAPTVTTEALTAQASQNLFEHMAQISQGVTHGASPAQVGVDVMQNLDGFLSRVQQFADRAGTLSSPSQPSKPQSLSSISPAGGNVSSGPASSASLEMTIKSLSLMFDHSIETQLVVRGATQVSGAANTLLKGQ
ncbi:hypothetical protein [Pseudomonas koreensis]|uniref:hypothetical protein n=1 Tax=Pseudomonas koreensis TaxID=198620 RepID=UPI002FC72A21